MLRQSPGMRRRPPEWLIGLVLAVLLFALLWAFRDRLGVGDDPSLDSLLVPTVIVV